MFVGCPIAGAGGWPDPFVTTGMDWLVDFAAGVECERCGGAYEYEFVTICTGTAAGTERTTTLVTVW